VRLLFLDWLFLLAFVGIISSAALHIWAWPVDGRPSPVARAAGVFAIEFEREALHFGHHLLLLPHRMLFIGAALLVSMVARLGLQRDGVIIKGGEE
jgi:hypothetical protein